jgi:1,4-alpha-glucan branching enzyme
MTRFHVLTRRERPGLHLWREGTTTRLYLHPKSISGGWATFEYDLEPCVLQSVHGLLFEYSADGMPSNYEDAAHRRSLPRAARGDFAGELWFAEGASRVLTADPRRASQRFVKLHLVSARRYRPSQAYLWLPGSGEGRRVDMVDEDALGPIFQIELEDRERSLFAFKFIRKSASGRFDEFEPEIANRLWSSSDGGELWTHSETSTIVPNVPQKKKLTLHFRQEFPEPAQLHLWQENSEIDMDVDPVAFDFPWATYEADLYTQLEYGALFQNPELPPPQRWEHDEAKRRFRCDDVSELWTLEGEHTLFETKPTPNFEVELDVAARSALDLGAGLRAHVWLNHARAPLHADVPADADGRVRFKTFPGVVTSVKFRDEDGQWENLARHYVDVPASGERCLRYVVVNRAPLLEDAPPPDLFRDPPFFIRRPGAYAEHGFLHFVVHAPTAARLRLLGEWAGFERNPIEMHLTRDGSYFWARVSIEEVMRGLGRDSYHGAEYKFLLNDREQLQDPAAGWVKTSWSGDCSRLVDHKRFHWTDRDWQRPGWQYLNIYQLHPARFSQRSDEAPLRRVARELRESGGYLRELGVTAILLLPVNEVGTENSWGYDPAYFYAIESSYGGPDALKELVDACHAHGLAVLLDVVFNHAGTADNILWSMARETFFDGDTAWGAMINFDHPQVRHFFAENLVYLANEYHIDGFRLDHTATIVHSHVWDGWSGFVRVRGSGGGWEFLHALRSALHEHADSRCLLMAEHLPNEWSLTNPGGPMDTQWCDDFHDRLVDACRRDLTVIPRLSEAFEVGNGASLSWYGPTNYPESHDEVGNVRDRIAYVAGYGQGFRMAKVAAAATLFSRGIPLFFMGAESGEDQRFEFGSARALDLDRYQSEPDRGRIRGFWRALGEARRNNPCIEGPSPLSVRFAEGQLLAFARGDSEDYFVLLNFGGWSGKKRLSELNLGAGVYRELWNSTWPAFAIACEDEGEHSNGGREARLHRGSELEIPDYGAIVLERVAR